MRGSIICSAASANILPQISAENFLFFQKEGNMDCISKLRFRQCAKNSLPFTQGGQQYPPNTELIPEQNQLIDFLNSVLSPEHRKYLCNGDLEALQEILLKDKNQTIEIMCSLEKLIFIEQILKDRKNSPF